MRNLLLYTSIILSSKMQAAPEIGSSRNLTKVPSSCADAIDVAPYINPQFQCLQEGLWREESEERKRYLAPTIPCNKVRRIDSGSDMFGETDAEAGIRNSTFFKTFKWLGAADRFDLARGPDPFLVWEGFHDPENPILQGAIARTMHEMIAEAQESVFLDMFLLGGSWGVEITRDLIRAAQRGVKVVLIHDTESVFAVGNEITPLWDRLLELSAIEANFVALEANLDTPARVSSVPFGIQGLLVQLAKADKPPVSAEGRSDHSKILIVDAVYGESPSEFVDRLTPKALVTSRNAVDSAGAYYFDESVLIEGPAAVASLLHYRSDIYWAWERAQSKNPTLYNEDDRVLMDSLLDRTGVMERGPLLVKSQGDSGVEAVQVSANDEVRNLDSGILRRIADARQSIDLYGKISYNWPLAIALKEAMARGVKVRMIFDQQFPDNALLNASLPYMMMKAPRRLPSGRKTEKMVDGSGRELKEEDLPVRWHLPFRPGYLFEGEDRTPLAQEIHAKTIIVDGQYTLFGSTNFDSLSWAGGFREYSVWIDDKAIASEARNTFTRIYNHPLLTISHKVWFGKARVPEQTLAFMSSLSSERRELDCPQSEFICDPETILRGGASYGNPSLKRDLIKNVIQRETERIKSVKTENFTIDAGGLVSCRQVGPL